MFHDVGGNTVFDDLLCRRTQERPALSVCHWGLKMAKPPKQKRQRCLQAFRCRWCCRGERWEAVTPCASLSLLSTSVVGGVWPASPAMLLRSTHPAGVGSDRRSTRVPLRFVCCSSSKMGHAITPMRCDSAGQDQPPTVSCHCLWLYR